MNLKTKRIISLLIDGSLILCLLKFFSNILESIFIDEVHLLIAKLPLLIFSIYIIINKDTIIGYESIGKKIMQLEIRQDDVRVTDKKILRGRNKTTMFKIPLCFFWIMITGVSDGDEKYNTRVVSKDS